MHNPDGERLQKVLSRVGYGSRRVAEDLIAKGHVTVNGELAELGCRVVEEDKVEVDGVPISVRQDVVYYLLNKPRGVVTTAKDPQRRETVVDLVPDEPRVYPVGRLDLDTEGLLLLTNDGDFANLITHPSHGIEKEYVVELDSHPTDRSISQLKNGVELDDGKTFPARVARVGDTGLRIVIHEGRNRQIRRMCEAVGHEVKRLVRTRIGPLSDQKLAAGSYRDLKIAEVKALSEAAEKPRSGTRKTRRAAKQPR